MSPSVASVLYSFPHPLGGPGINHTAWQQVRGLAAAGVRVTVYCTSLRVPLPPSVRVVQTMVVAGRRVPHRAVGMRRAYDWHDRRVSAALRRDPDVDVVHCWPSSGLRTMAVAGTVGVPVCREVPSPYTATAVADAGRAAADVGLRTARDSIHRDDPRRQATEHAEFERADVLLMPSDYVRRTFLDQGIEPRRLVRHQYGYDPDRFRDPGPGDPSRPFTAVFVGRGEPAKGLHVALEAWQRSGAGREGRLLVAGRMDPDYATALAKPLGDRSVELLGFVDDVPRLLSRADVLVLPSYSEGSALVVLEAMACGVIPLVSTATGAPIQQGVDGYLHEVGDAVTLTEQLGAVAREPRLRLRLRGAALTTSATFTWEQATIRLLAAYATAGSMRTRR